MRTKSASTPVSFLTNNYNARFVIYDFKSQIPNRKSKIFWLRLGQVRKILSFICVICAICGFNCFFIGTRATSLYLFADELRPSPAWEVSTEDARLASTALKIAKESYPEIDIEHYLKKLENIIENIRTSLRDETEPEQIIKTINVVLFNELQFKYVQTGELEHISLNKVLDTKIGNCVGLSILYLSIAEGLHLPIYGVSVPEHIFVRYDDGDFRRNIEAGYEGIFTPDSYYINMHGKRISQKSIRNGCYLKNLSMSEVVADIYLNRSIIHKEKGNIEAALKDVNHAIELHGNDAVAYCNRGVIYEKMKDSERAISDYNKAIELNPDYAPAYYNRGSLYAAIEAIDKAIMDYSKALSLDPGSILSYYNRSIAFKMIGRPDLTIEDLSKAISLAPKFAAAYASRGLTYAESGEPEKALEDFNKALELNPNNTEIYMKRSVLHADAQRFDDAIKDITTFIEFSPGNAFAYYIRAKAYRGKGDTQKCMEDYNKVVELSPRLAGVYYERGQIKNQLEMTDEALADFNTSIELFPYNPLAYLHRGSTFKKLGKNEQALKDYLTYLKLNPDAPDAEEIKKEIEDMQNKR
ncbi:MAG: tetratricopeptide repeat protein [Planctomycetes bacterium]|nr:tetratricopeptide repeat protein [Planctomycetota bacterium]